MWMIRSALVTSWGVLASLAVATGTDVPQTPSETLVDCYVPIPGGWRILLSDDPASHRLTPGSQIGVVERGRSVTGEGHAMAQVNADDNPRLHRRPLYPPADKSLVWTEAERAKMPQCGFRPLILAYNEPRFLIDAHAAGGLLGHLFVGMTEEDGGSKWFHQWSEIEVQYVDGRLEYELRDPAFPGVTASLRAMALSDSVGIILRVRLAGLTRPCSLVWAYGGASAYFTNYAMTAPEFAFSPGQCAKDRVLWDEHGFILRRAFDKSDSIMEQVFAAPRFIPNWEATIQGRSSWRDAERGYGAPEAFQPSPIELCASAAWSQPHGSQSQGLVLVERIPLESRDAEGFIVVGMGGRIEKDMQRPREAMEASMERNRQIASRVVVKSPDPYLDAAATMMAFAMEGTWGDSTVMHGGWSWRFGYLGWRGWYGTTCYGWTDRIRRSIQNQIAYGLIRKGEDAGALSSLLDTPGGVFYNMNEVFLDQVRQYFDYTGDLDLMREIFPTLKGIVDWENRRLQPGGANLYENSLNTWISDSHWTIQGQCTQASAYMLGAHRFLADLAAQLGEDPLPYRQKAKAIVQAAQDALWMPKSGTFAEYLDTRGARLLHPEPELPTLYHAAEFGLASPTQITQMLDWARTHLKTEKTPGGGRFYWSSNWFPNSGRSYTHSTYEMAYAEELNFALTHQTAGLSDEAYEIIRASLCGVFNGPTPGGLSCHAKKDGRQRANDEFADAISLWGRTVVEGLFGIVPKKQDKIIRLSPSFPSAWDQASIETPQFSYRLRREERRILIDWESPEACAVHLRLPLKSCKIEEVLVERKPAELRMEPGAEAGIVWLRVETSLRKRGSMEVRTAPQDPIPIDPLAVTREETAPPESIRVWTSPGLTFGDLIPWTLVDLGSVYNSTLLEALDKVSKEATPPPAPASRVGFDYWKSHLGSRHHGDPVQIPSDAAWRAKVGPDGVAWTTDGIPFKTSAVGPNIGIVTQTGPYPTQIEFPVGAKGQSLFLMLSGMSFPTQSHVCHLRIILKYEDQTEERTDLVSPFTLGDCWSTWCGRWHDTPTNGFENLGGRFGPAGSIEAQDLTQPVNVDTEAHLVKMDLRRDATLASVQVEAVPNDILFGIMGATVLK